MLRLIAVTAVALGLVLATAGSAAACSCIAIAPSTQLKQSDGAVTARLLEVNPVAGGTPTSSAGPTDFVYRIGRVIKGKARLQSDRRLVVRSAYDSASCGLSNREGEVHGLFLAREKGRWRSGACSEIPAWQMRRLGRTATYSRAGTTSVC